MSGHTDSMALQFWYQRRSLPVARWTNSPSGCHSPNDRIKIP